MQTDLSKLIFGESDTDSLDSLLTARRPVPSSVVFDSLSARQAAELVNIAHALMDKQRYTAHDGPLHGKHLGLICAAPDGADAMLFCRAATELGANVAVIRQTPIKPGVEHQTQSTGRVLALLYDALECQGMPLAVYERLTQVANVPVYAGLATPGHPTASVANMLGGGATPEDKRRFVVQAALLKTLLQDLEMPANFLRPPRFSRSRRTICSIRGSQFCKSR